MSIELHDKRLIEAYQEMADHTNPECGKCLIPYSCCAPEYCEHTIRSAKEKLNVVLEPTSHPRLPLMGVNGCIAAPHLRPLCAVHTCSVNKFGMKIDDNDREGAYDWNCKYFELRDEINRLEWIRECNEQTHSG